jgi:BlaI family transcriptional regulator, penicillinase repressor
MPPNISEAEWEVMRAVWAGHPATANEVVERLAGEKDWSPRTIKTMLNRLVKKRALGFTEEGKRYLYRPLVSREECVRDESRSFLDRVFGGALGPMLNHFVRNEKLSAEEIAELKRLLARKEK